MARRRKKELPPGKRLFCLRREFLQRLMHKTQAAAALRHSTFRGLDCRAGRSPGTFRGSCRCLRDGRGGDASDFRYTADISILRIGKFQLCAGLHKRKSFVYIDKCSVHMGVALKGEVVAGASGNNGVCHGGYGSGDLCALRFLGKIHILKIQRLSVIALRWSARCLRSGTVRHLRRRTSSQALRCPSGR